MNELIHVYEVIGFKQTIETTWINGGKAAPDYVAKGT